MSKITSTSFAVGFHKLQEFLINKSEDSIFIVEVSSMQEAVYVTEVPKEKVVVVRNKRRTKAQIEVDNFRKYAGKETGNTTETTVGVD